MARGTTLANLRSMLKAELGHSMTTGVAVGQDTELNTLLADMQKWLWAQYQWPFLYGHADVSIIASTRFFTLPATISLDYPTKVEVKFGSLWYDVDFGITGEQYTDSDSESSVLRDPVERWQTYSTTQFEVWPMPATAQTLRFWGTKTLSALATDSDTADLDDVLIVLFTAAEKLARSKQADAQSKLRRAQEHFLRLKGANRPNTVFALSQGDDFDREKERIISVVGNS